MRRTTLTDAEETFVQAQRVARLATADEHGQPHVVPVCYAFDGTHFFIALDEKPKRVSVTNLRRVHNIEVRPEVSLLIDQYDDDWSRLGYVLIAGQAHLVEAGTALHSQALRYVRERYVQYRTMALEQYPVIAITPTRVISWGPALKTS